MQAQGLTYIHEFGGIATITVTAKAMYYRAKRIIVGWLWGRSRMVWILLEFDYCWYCTLCVRYYGA
jgi:hypothetical protein